MSSRQSNKGFVAGAFFCVFAAAASLVLGFYVTKFINLAVEYRTGQAAGSVLSDIGSCGIAALIAAVFFAVIVCCDRYRRIPRWLVRYRYVLSAVVLVLCCALEISGSSISMWAEHLGGDRAGGTLFGIPRWIRSDEWDVSTPLAFSQVATGNLSESPVLQGGGADVSLFPALPAWSCATLFRPHYWGYLVLGMSRGLAFCWAGRVLALALVTFEFARLLTNRNDALSVCAVILITMSPVVQWWFAPDILIYGQGLVLCLHALVSKGGRARRWLYSVLLSYLLCCYALIMYPAWQIPMVYVFGAAGIWACWKAKTAKEVTWGALLKPAIPPFLVAVVVSVGILALIVWQASDVVAIVSNTAYPGAREEHGGGGVSFLVSYFERGAAMLVSPLYPYAFLKNVCVSSAYIALVPFGLAILLVLMIGKRDFESLFLLIPFAILVLYGTVGFPGALARITLLSNTPLARLEYPLGYLDAMMLIFACHKLERVNEKGVRHSQGRAFAPVPLVTALCVALPFAAISVFAAYAAMPNGVPRTAYAIIACSSGLGAFAMLMPSSIAAAKGRSRAEYLLIWALGVLVAGFCINPIQQGVAELTESELYETIASIEKEDPGKLWIGEDAMYGQVCVAAGARSLSSVNSYPNLDAWRTIDPSGEFDDIYNRYAHISVYKADESSFELTENDRFSVFLDDEGALDLDIDYWIANSDLAEHNSELIEFTPIAEANGATIYKVDHLRMP